MSTRSVDQLERLVAIEAIRRLKACYFRSVDLRDWEGLRTVVTDDVTFFRAPQRLGPVAAEPAATGREAFIAFVQAALDGATSMHRGYEPELDVLDSARAAGIWPMQDRILHPTDPERRFAGNGHYHETYQRGLDGTWRISSITLTRVDLEIIPLGEPRP